MDKDLRASVIHRATHTCELCGRWADPDTLQAHHRKLRTRGGEDSLENLVALHLECHGWVHANPAEATALGFMVSAWEDPATVPVMLHRRRLMLPGATWRKP
jgi:hypothetical protein